MEELILALKNLISDINFIGSVSSIVSLLVSLIVLNNVSKLRSQFLFKGRISQLENDLRIHISKLSGFLRTYSNSSHEFVAELALTDVDLNSIQNKISGSLKTKISKIRKIIKQFRKVKNTRSQEDAANLIIDLDTILKEITNLREDLKWNN